MSSDDKPAAGSERLKPERVAVSGLVKGDMMTAVEIGAGMAFLNFLNDPPPGVPGAWATLGIRGRAAVRLALGLLLPVIGACLYLAAESAGLIPRRTSQRVPIIANILITTFVFIPGAFISWGLLGVVTGKSWDRLPSSERALALALGAVLSVASAAAAGYTLVMADDYLVHYKAQTALDRQMPEDIRSGFQILRQAEEAFHHRMGRYGRAEELGIDRHICLEDNISGCTASSKYYFDASGYEKYPGYKLIAFVFKREGIPMSTCESESSWELDFDGHRQELSHDLPDGCS